MTMDVMKMKREHFLKEKEYKARFELMEKRRKKLNERNHLVLMLINYYVSVNVLWYRMFFFENFCMKRNISTSNELQQQHN